MSLLSYSASTQTPCRPDMGKSIRICRSGRLQLIALAALCSLGASDLAGAAGSAVDARITNTPANPVPVVAVPAASTPQVTCSLPLSSVGFGSTGSPFLEDVTRAVTLASSLHCPVGVTAIEVTRVSFDPYGGITSRNAAQGVISVGLQSKSLFSGMVPFITLSMASPEGVPSEPIRLDSQSAEALSYRRGCSSGIPNVSPVCGGMLFFTGTPR